MQVSPGRIAARAMIAAARGVAPGLLPSRCMVCGPSRYPASDYDLGTNFGDHDELADPAAPGVCTGCASILAGRPGDDPPPLRTVNVLVVEGRATYPPANELHPLLRSPPSSPFVVAWAASRQRHAALRAEVSTDQRIAIGADQGTVVYRPTEHAPVLDAIEGLLRGFSRDEIRAGDWSPIALARFGLERWMALEDVVAPWRPSPLLDMLCALAPRQERDPPTEATMTAQETDDWRAARLVAALAEASPQRAKDGIGFWRALLPRRVNARKGLPLRDALSRLASDLGCPVAFGADGVAAVLAGVEGLTAEDVRGVELALRDRPAFVLTLAYQTVRERKESRARAHTEESP